MYAKALANRQRRTYDCKTIDEIKEKLAAGGDGFVRAMWCGDPECEDKVKAETGVGSRCIPLEAGAHLRDLRLLRKAREVARLLGLKRIDPRVSA